MKRLLIACLVAGTLTGCASIFNGTTQSVVLHSAPQEGAAVSVTNRAGETVHTGTTPVTLTLKRGAGYFKGESYTIRMKKEGFADKEIVLTPTVSGWYFGNLMLGGLLGMLAIDPATGGMYTFPDSVTGTLNAAGTPTSSAGSLTIVSTDALSPEQMRHARLVATAR
ncbi:hypothetical protein PGB34_22300 [Xenophilus arseniciresistens]|uniref:PEGA domain-containing protein n=1 Tax=Xenophilus arseniciresistens TaxID=1283306 RepID=A0AAE3NDA0_9BURK|nr:hypothetical protein [Xenophilus arseniciresistens]MDA7419113.1 hypothetical protein [Xenophilus arseniciresistens]